MQIQALDSRRHIRDQADDAVYRFSPATPRLPGVTAALAYLAPATERPCNYMARLCRKYDLAPTRRAGSVVCARGAIAPSARGTLGAASRLVKYAQPVASFARPNFLSIHRRSGC
jgi:hypothetical protein